MVDFQMTTAPPPLGLGKWFARIWNRLNAESSKFFDSGDLEQFWLNYAGSRGTKILKAVILNRFCNLKILNKKKKYA